MLSLLLAATLVLPAPEDQAVLTAIRDEIAHGIDATVDQDIDRYMDGVPADYRIVEDDGSITDRDTLRAKQMQAWAIIRRTNGLTIDVSRIEIGCERRCATVWTDQRWDRQMLGRDGTSEFNVVTMQAHRETWQQRDGRWIQTDIEELGGHIWVDGQPYAG